VLRVSAGGSQTIESAATWDAAANSWVPVPIRAGPATDRLFLTLYATGLRHQATGSSVRATVNGIDVAVLYAAAQPAYPGVDQVNLELPGSLAGSGQVTVIVTVDGQPANPVTVTFQ